MSFLGPVGSLIPVKCASQLTVAGGSEVSFTRTLGKQKAFLGKVSAREWNVDIGLAKPYELSGLRWLAENVNSPMVWYSPDAVVGNVLEPGPADLIKTNHDGFEGALTEVEPSIWVKAALPDGSALALTDHGGGFHMTPVRPGSPITVSVWLLGNTLSGRQMIRAIWRDAGGLNLGTVDTDFEVSDGFTRRHVTLEPPVGAAQINLLFYAAQVAGPAVTLTDQLMPYSPGRGAKRVVVHGLADAVIRAYKDQQYGSLSFTVSEVG